MLKVLILRVENSSSVMVLSSEKRGLPVREALPWTHLSMQIRDS